MASRPRSEQTYDVFISYAHEDAAAAAWLADYLAHFWVPGKKRRRIFLDHTHLVSGGGLSGELKRNLAASRYLVVCCSSAAAGSPWVNLEIDEFVHSHASGNDEDTSSHACPAVMACRVGSDERIHLPSALRWVQRELQDELFLPDLRGAGKGAAPPVRKRIRREAAALLAPVVGLRSKEEVLAAIRRRRLMWLAGMVALGCVVGVAAAGWNRWLATPEGAYYAMVEEVLDAAAKREVVRPEVITAARALGRQDQPDKVDQVSKFVREKEFQAIVRSAGLVSLPKPDCATAVAALASLDPAAAKTWSVGPLLVERACGGAGRWVNRLRPDLSKPDSLPGWFERLADADDLDEAEQVLQLPGYPAKDVLEARAALAIKRGVNASFQADDVRKWIGGEDALDVMYRGLKLLRGFELAGRMADPLAHELVRVCHAAAGALSIDQASNWNFIQQLAAHAAVIGQRKEALELLGRRKERSNTDDPSWGIGWAWRALAFERLADAAGAREAFDQVPKCLDVVPPASRSYNELESIAEVYVLANRWPDAFRTTEYAKEEQVQILQRCKLMGLWIAHGGSTPWPWRLRRKRGFS